MDATQAGFVGPASGGDLVASGEASASSQLQAIVDEASRILGRPVVVDDRQLRLLAHTRHGEDEVDGTRMKLLMKQPLPTELFEWLGRYDAWTARRPFRVPANPDLAMNARVGAPIRCHGHHLGSIWCTDRDGTMTDAELDRLGEFADEAAVVLYREMLLLDLDRSRERELLRDILSPDEDVRSEAAWQLAELELFTADGRTVVLVIPFGSPDQDRFSDNARSALEAVLMRVRRRLAPKHGVHLLRPDHALMLVSLADPSIRTGGIAEFASQLHEDVGAALSGSGDAPKRIVAVGGAVRRLANAAESYQQALRAADVAMAVSAFGNVVCWDDLGIYQMLTRISIDMLGSSELHSGMAKLLDSPRADELVPTLERYLDLAGDVQRTARSLYLHRTTLYHRLRRIEQVAEVDLGKGEDRLALHLSLKLARLQGLTSASQADSADSDRKGGERLPS